MRAPPTCGLLSRTKRFGMRFFRQRWLATAVLAGLLGACAAPRVATPPGAVAPAAPAHPELLILESSDAPVYARVTAELLRVWPGKTQVETLAANGPAVTSRVRQSRAPLVAAIGLPAALAARGLRDKRVVFCQVFNYRGHRLLSARMKGVEALPPPTQHFAAWQSVSPQLKRVALVTGPGFDNLLADARGAAAAHGITLSHGVVNSDLEALYAFKRLGPDIQGLWLLPDNRILSVKLLREVLTLAKRQGIEVLVSNPELLRLGARLSVEADPADVARQVGARLYAAAAPGTAVPGPAMFALTAVKVQTATRSAAKVGGGLQPARKPIYAN